VKAFYHCRAADLAEKQEKHEEAAEHWKKAIENYIEAGVTYPEDDENRACQYPDGPFASIL
jgi:hypothetical protein